MNQVELDSKEIKDVLSYLIDNNKNIQTLGKTPIATEIIGESGLGKTSISLQLAKELNLHHVKLNLAQIEELGDLVGFPMRQFQMTKGGVPMKQVVINGQGQKEIKTVMSTGSGEKIWVDEVATEQYTKNGYSFTGQKRMSYCPPEWIADKAGGGLLILDDWNRADTRFIQAVMELVDRQEYISWKLPENWHIILTANPDDGNYMVNAIDVAQKTRFISIVMKWNVDRWAEWAEQNALDGRCINFLLMHQEVVKGAVNPRSLTNFFNSITSISDFNTSLPLIQNLGEGSVGPEVAFLFTGFINNKMDKWITPKEVLLSADVDAVTNRLFDIFGKGNDYRADIASVMTTRLINFALYYAESNSITPEIVKRITTLVKEQGLFTDDLNYHLIKKLLAGNKNKFKTLVFDSEIQEIATK